MRIRRFAATAAAAAAAVAGLAIGVPAAGAASGSNGFIYVSIMGTNPANNATRSIILTGSITAGGVDHSGNKTDTAVFPDGTFTITHSPGVGTPRFNARTCLGRIAENGTYTLSGGTGAYAGISGHGIYRVNITLVGARNSSGQCSNKPAAFQFLVKAQGPVSGA